MMPRSSRTKSCRSSCGAWEQLQTENKELLGRSGSAGPGAAAGRLKTKEAEQAQPPPHGPGAQPGGTGEALAAPVTLASGALLSAVATLVEACLHFLPAPVPRLPMPTSAASDLGKFQVATDALKSREPQAKPQLDLSN